MNIYLNLAEDYRILSASYTTRTEGENIVESLPEGDIIDYKYIDSEFVYDPLPQPEPPAPEPTQIDLVEAQALYTAMMTDTLL